MPPPISPPSWRFGLPAAVLAFGCVVFGVVPSLEDSLAAASVHGLYEGSGTVHLAIWHGWNLELALSAVALGGGLALFVLVDRGRVSLAHRSGLPDGERGVPHGAPRGRTRVSPGHRGRAERFAPGLCRGDPRDGGRAPGVGARDRMGLDGMARRGRPHRRHPDRRFPRRRRARRRDGSPPVRGRRLPRRDRLCDGRALRRVRRTRPRPDTGHGGDPVDGRVRPRSAAPPRTVRAAIDGPSPRRAARDRGPRRRDGVRLRDRGELGVVACFGLGRDGAARGSRRPRSQCRERHPRRLPRARYPRRDHRVGGRLDRSSRAGTGGPPRRRRARSVPPCEQPRPSATARVRRRIGASHVPRRRDGVAVVALRGTQPTGRRFRGRALGRLARSRSATSPGGSTKFGHSRVSSRGWCSVPVCWSPGQRQPFRSSVEVPCSTSRAGR